MNNKKDEGQNGNYGIESNTILLKNILEESVYVIPAYQRPYEWKYSQIDKVLEEIFSLADNEASKEEYAFLGSLQFNINENGYDALINDKDLVDVVKKNAEEFLGEGSFIFKDYPSMGGEDFSFFTENCKGAFFHVGCANKEKGITSLIHTADFDIDERCLSIGAIMHTLNVLYFN